VARRPATRRHPLITLDVLPPEHRSRAPKGLVALVAASALALASSGGSAAYWRAVAVPQERAAASALAQARARAAALRAQEAAAQQVLALQAQLQQALSVDRSVPRDPLSWVELLGYLATQAPELVPSSVSATAAGNGSYTLEITGTVASEPALLAMSAALARPPFGLPTLSSVQRAASGFAVSLTVRYTPPAAPPASVLAPVAGPRAAGVAAALASGSA